MLRAAIRLDRPHRDGCLIVQTMGAGPSSNEGHRAPLSRDGLNGGSARMDAAAGIRTQTLTSQQDAGQAVDLREPLGLA